MFNSAVILAGGKGTRFLEETKFIPKPMIKANGKPLLLHIINHYKKFEVRNFYILTGYKGHVIKKFFNNINDYKYNNSTFYHRDGTKVQLIDTGKNTLTGGRLKIFLSKIAIENFYLTYGDGISDVNINTLTKFHIKQETLATLTAVNPPPRFGLLEINKNYVKKVREKNEIIPTWINGGFFVLNRGIEKFISKDEAFEEAPLSKLAKINQLTAYKHLGYWQCVDTIRELEILEEDIKLKKIKI